MDKNKWFIVIGIVAFYHLPIVLLSLSTKDVYTSQILNLWTLFSVSIIILFLSIRDHKLERNKKRLFGLLMGGFSGMWLGGLIGATIGLLIFSLIFPPKNNIYRHRYLGAIHKAKGK